MSHQFRAEDIIVGKQGWKVDIPSPGDPPRTPIKHHFCPSPKDKKIYMHYATTFDRSLFSKIAGLVLVVTPISIFNISVIFLIDKRTQDMRTWRIL